MKKSGGIIAIIGSILNVFMMAVLISFHVVGGISRHLASDASSGTDESAANRMMFILGICVFSNIILSVLSLDVKSKLAAILLAISSVIAIILGDPPLIYSMGLTLVGALIVLFGDAIGQSINASINQMRGQSSYQEPHSTQTRPPSIPLD
jgi:uncharacterized protein YdbL (DUF1318 family)